MSAASKPGNSHSNSLSTDSISRSNNRTPELTEHLERIGQEILASLDTLVDRFMARAFGEVPRYADTPAEEIAPAMKAVLSWAVGAIVEGRDLSAQEIELLAQWGQVRARQGIPPESTLLSVQLAASEVYAAANDAAERLGIPSSVVREIVLPLNNITAIAMSSLISAHQQVQGELAQRDVQRRADFLRGAVEGTLSAAGLSEGTTFGLSPDRKYMVCRTHVTSDDSMRRMERMLGDSQPGPMLSGLIDRDFVALLTLAPVLEEEGITIGLGPAESLGELPASFRLASRALEAATAAGIHGVVRFEDLGLIPAVADESEVSRGLMKRYIEPLTSAGEFADALAETVRSYMDNGMDIRRAAAVLNIHPNTLRYRLRRFAELTGADLGRTETLFEVWWALRRDAIDRRALQA